MALTQKILTSLVLPYAKQMSHNKLLNLALLSIITVHLPYVKHFTCAGPQPVHDWYCPCDITFIVPIFPVLSSWKQLIQNLNRITLALALLSSITLHYLDIKPLICTGYHNL